MLPVPTGTVIVVPPDVLYEQVTVSPTAGVVDVQLGPADAVPARARPTAATPTPAAMRVAEGVLTERMLFAAAAADQAGALRWPTSSSYFTTTRRLPSATTPALPRAVVVTVHVPLARRIVHV